METLLKKLSAETCATKQINCVDTTIVFHSTHEDLLSHFTSPLEYFLPHSSDSQEDQPAEVTCILAPTTMVENWPHSLEISGDKVSYMNDTSLGDATLLNFRQGACLLINDIGSIYSSGKGEFLCLVNPLPKGSNKGIYPNIVGLLTILVSETLISSNKLLVHAGAVGKAESGQIWAGDSGSGKTTRILNLVRDGFDFFGEDLIIIGRGKDGKWRIWPYWRYIMASAQTSKLFPTPQDVSDRPPNPRNKYYFSNISEVLQVEKPAPVLLSEINKIIPGNHKILRTLGFHDAFKEISPGFLHALLPGSTPVVMDIVLDLISDIPVNIVSWDMLDEFDKRQDQ